MLWIDHKYVGLASNRLPKFKRKSDKLYSFRCVFCGDSQKDKNKTRGYLYVHKDRISYKCHNCNLSTSLYKLLNHLDSSLGNAYKLEQFSNNHSTFAHKVPAILEKKPKIEPSESNILIDLGLIPAHLLPENHRIVNYLQSRKIPRSRWVDLYYARDMRVLEKLNKSYENRLISEERMVIPFRDMAGNITGVTGRAMGNNKLRYVTVRVTDDAMIDGLNLLDLSQTIYVTEGPIDSMFVDNAIAVGGSDFKRVVAQFDRNKIILIFDNQPRNKQLVDIMNQMITQNYKLVIWPSNWRYKDINEAIIDGITSSTLMQTLHTHSHQHLTLKLAMREWNKCQ